MSTGSSRSRRHRDRCGIWDYDAATQAVSDLLVALGRDASSEHLIETPRRVVGAFAELLTPKPFDLTTFPNDEGYDELVVVRDIPFRSLCEHHLLPFTGSPTSATSPAADPRAVEAGQGGRAVRALTCRPKSGSPSRSPTGSRVPSAERGRGGDRSRAHLYVLRGVRASGARTVTSALHGLLAMMPGAARSSSHYRRGPVRP